MRGQKPGESLKLHPDGKKVKEKLLKSCNKDKVTQSKTFPESQELYSTY